MESKVELVILTAVCGETLLSKKLVNIFFSNGLFDVQVSKQARLCARVSVYVCECARTCVRNFCDTWNGNNV